MYNDATDNVDTYPYDYVSSVDLFQKKTNGNNLINVDLCSVRGPALTTILHFHSSKTFSFGPIHSILNCTNSAVVCNFISWNNATSLYPQPTYEYKLNLTFHPIMNEIALQKYTDRGFNTVRSISLTDPRMCLFYPSARHVNDKSTWTFSLNTKNIPSVEEHDTTKFLST
ncbi:MAG TPA: hypothetical protein VGO47_08385, partial [Chlamydiales bacterium]|nr:hypothetical protein [Chlamydiales bacterium]